MTAFGRTSLGAFLYMFNIVWVFVALCPVLVCAAGPVPTPSPRLNPFEAAEVDFNQVGGKGPNLGVSRQLRPGLFGASELDLTPGARPVSGASPSKGKTPSPLPSRSLTRLKTQDLEDRCSMGSAGYCAELGRRVEDLGDSSRAFKLYRGACEEYDEVGCLELGRMLGDAGDFDHAKEALSRVCDRGSTRACESLIKLRSRAKR